MKILVTGANGYMGTGIIDNLINLGNEVVATDFNTKGVNAKAKCIDGNVFEVENPYEYFGKPDIVLHLAWRNGFVHNADSHLEDLPNHYKFLKKMSESGVKKIVALGTMHEIGFYEGRITENTPCNPLSMYGIAKNALRKSLELLTKQNKTMFQWLRGYYIVGNSEKGCSIFSKITKAVNEGKKEFPFTTGQCQYDFLNYDVFCNQIANATINNNILGVINCCSGKPITLAARVEQFIKENSYDIKLNYGAFPDRPYDSLAVWGDDSKIKEIMKQNREQKK